MYMKARIRNDLRGVSPVIATILLVAVTVVLAAILYVMTSGLVGGNTVTPMIGATKTQNANDYIWTVNAVTGGASIPLIDIYVQLKNETGFVIASEPLFTTGGTPGCNGTHGLRFIPATRGNYISVGDSFYLSRAYKQGCTLTLVNPSTTSLYAAFAV